MDFTSNKISELMRRLLAPSWKERQSADHIMMMITLGQEKDSKGRWKGLISEAIDLLDLDLDTYLAALISFWADYAEMQYRKRMAYFSEGSSTESKTLSPGWQSPAIKQFPLKDKVEINNVMDYYGFGIGKFLEGIGPRAAGRAKQLAACLEHPELVVQDHAMVALGSMGPAARTALPAMVGSIKIFRLCDSPFEPRIAVSRVIDDDSESALRIASAIDPEGDPKQVAGPCAVLRLLSAPNLKLVDVIFEKYQKASSENSGFLLGAGAELAERFHYAENEFFDIATKLAGSPNPDHREAAAEAFNYFSRRKETEKMIISLAADPDLMVRSAAHRSAANIVPPSDELIRTVANDLGNCEGHDDVPHYWVLKTLTQWGEYSRVVISKISTWIEELADSSDGFEYNEIKDLVEFVESLGPSAVSLKEPLEKLIEPEEEDEEEMENEFDEVSEDTSNKFKMLREIFIPGLESFFAEWEDLDVPVTEFSEEECLDPWESLVKIVKKL